MPDKFFDFAFRILQYFPFLYFVQITFFTLLNFVFITKETRLDERTVLSCKRRAFSSRRENHFLSKNETRELSFSYRGHTTAKINTRILPSRNSYSEIQETKISSDCSFGHCSLFQFSSHSLSLKNNIKNFIFLVK